MAEQASSDCIFCRIASGDTGAELIADSEAMVAFRDVNPQAPVHVLIVPKVHVGALRDLDAAGLNHFGNELLAMATRVARQEDLLAGGYRVVINDGPDAGQTIFHLHAHVLGGAPLHLPLG